MPAKPHSARTIKHGNPLQRLRSYFSGYGPRLPLLIVWCIAAATLAGTTACTAFGKRSPLNSREIARGVLPAPSKKDAARMTFDPERPCFNRGEIARARRALFQGRKARNSGAWMRALNQAFYDLGANCADNTLLVTVLSLIQQESGVSADPRLENRNLPKLLGFKLQRLSDSNPLAATLLSASGIEAALKAKLRRDHKRVKLRTEGDLVRYVEGNLKVWFVKYLQKEYSIPGPVARLAAEIGISSPVSTIGPMQVNVEKAYRNARDRGDAVRSPNHMRSLLLDRRTALRRGLKEGVHLVWKSYRFYRRLMPAREAARFTAADYNSGEFSSRNAAFQARVARLAGKKLVLDGDLLVYRNGSVQELISNTEETLKTILPSYSWEQIRETLLLEKSAAFSKTRTARAVCIGYKRRVGKPCQVARLPAGAGNATARMKMGRGYTPKHYAESFMKRFDKNLNLFRKT